MFKRDTKEKKILFYFILFLYCYVERKQNKYIEKQ